jgi:hypothetical protein
MTMLTIMRILPCKVDPMVYKMSLEDPGSAMFASIGGLGEQVRELCEVCWAPQTILALCVHSLLSDVLFPNYNACFTFERLSTFLSDSELESILGSRGHSFFYFFNEKHEKV